VAPLKRLPVAAIVVVCALVAFALVVHWMWRHPSYYQAVYGGESFTVNNGDPPQFHRNLDCTKAEETNSFDFQQYLLEHPDMKAWDHGWIVQKIPIGCWSGVITLPDAFNDGWCYQPDSTDDANDNWAIAWKFIYPTGRTVDIFSPIHWGETPNFAYRPLTFKLQALPFPDGHAPGIQFRYGKGKTGGKCEGI
jgi:hypothetical protein